jgi:hypothetical protein
MASVMAYVNLATASSNFSFEDVQYLDFGVWHISSGSIYGVIATSACPPGVTRTVTVR